MTSKKLIFAASGLIIASLLVRTFYTNPAHEVKAQPKNMEHTNFTQEGVSSGVSPVPVAGTPKIAVIGDSPEKDISALLAKNEVPDEIYTVQVMKLLADTKLNLTVRNPSKEQSLEMTPERLSTLSEVIEKAQDKSSYNNTSLLSVMLENWTAGNYSTLPQDLDTLQNIERLNAEAFKAIQAKKAAEIAPAKAAFIQEIKQSVGEQKELPQEHFDSALENWYAAPHSTKEPYQLADSEIKKIAEKVYREGTLTSVGEVLAEYEKMFTNPKLFTYDRYVALAYYLTSSQNKTDSYHFQIFYPLPYFPTEATDKATAAFLISESYAKLHTFVDQLK
ncbi:hypothetical protein ACE6ED_03015 [Paenibacillus sp. CN-4]|uniref:hypothetical protein n=1 Tax=Paenibacillus nanchangensis TaxID=3348343 RepID=UPI00397ABFA3